MWALLGRTLVGALWLPLALAVVLTLFSVLSGGIRYPGPFFLVRMLWSHMGLLWLLGIPLALAFLLIRRRDPELAGATAVICVPVSLFFWLLDQPLPHPLNTLFGAALGWIVLALLYLTNILRYLARLPGRLAQRLRRRPSD
ncbi:hypothetical protein [Candidatus Foliamicus sp.]